MPKKYQMMTAEHAARLRKAVRKQNETPLGRSDECLRKISDAVYAAARTGQGSVTFCAKTCDTTLFMELQGTRRKKILDALEEAGYFVHIGTKGSDTSTLTTLEVSWT